MIQVNTIHDSQDEFYDGPNFKEFSGTILNFLRYFNL
jgi:hypothetical protein